MKSSPARIFYRANAVAHLLMAGIFYGVLRGIPSSAGLGAVLGLALAFLSGSVILLIWSRRASPEISLPLAQSASVLLGLLASAFLLASGEAPAAGLALLASAGLYYYGLRALPL